MLTRTGVARGHAAPSSGSRRFPRLPARANRNHYCTGAIENQAFAIVASIKLTAHSISFCLGIKRTAQFLGNYDFFNLDVFSR
jgi:hypothetical protein